MVFMWFLNYEWSWRVILEIVCIWLSINLLVSSLKGWMTPCNLDFLLWIYLQWALSIPIFHFIIRDHFIFWRIVVLLNYKNIVCVNEMIPQVKAAEQVIITEYSIMYHVVNWKYWTLQVVRDSLEKIWQSFLLPSINLIGFVWCIHSRGHM